MTSSIVDTNQRVIIGLKDSFQEFMHACVNGADALTTWINVRFVSASAPFSHAWTPEKKLLILIFFQWESFPYFKIIKLISFLLSIGDYRSFSSAAAILFTLVTQKSSSGTQKFIELWTDKKKQVTVLPPNQKARKR